MEPHWILMVPAVWLCSLDQECLNGIFYLQKCQCQFWALIFSIIHYHHNSRSNLFLFTGCFNIRTNSCHFLDPLPCYQPQRSSLILLLSILMLCHPRGLVLPFQNTQLDIMFPLFLVHQFWQRSWNQQGRNLPLIEAAGVIRHFSSP